MLKLLVDAVAARDAAGTEPVGIGDSGWTRFFRVDRLSRVTIESPEAPRRLLEGQLACVNVKRSSSVVVTPYPHAIF